MANIFSDFLALLFPPKCIGCAVLLGKDEPYLCLDCETTLRMNHLNIGAQAALKVRLHGKAQISESFVAFKYVKGGIVQHLIYEVKYKDQKLAGYWLGARLGDVLNEVDWNGAAPILIPVPLHKSKMLKRGFNQSEFFARGLAESMVLKVDSTSLIRVERRSSQTNKGRFQRWLNAEYLYVVKNPKSIQGQHVILVDDVVTTGATIESCANVLFEAGAIKVSVIAMAVAMRAGE